MNYKEFQDHIQEKLGFRNDLVDSILREANSRMRYLEGLEAIFPIWFLMESETIYMSPDGRYDLSVDGGGVKQPYRVMVGGVSQPRALMSGWSTVGTDLCIDPVPDPKERVDLFIQIPEKLINRMDENKWLIHAPYLLAGYVIQELATSLGYAAAFQSAEIMIQREIQTLRTNNAAKLAFEVTL